MFKATQSASNHVRIGTWFVVLKYISYLRSTQSILVIALYSDKQFVFIITYVADIENSQMRMVELSTFFQSDPPSFSTLLGYTLGPSLGP